MYVKIFGMVRVFKEDIGIVGTHISPITKYDTVTNHFLQVFVAHNVRIKGVLTVRNSHFKCLCRIETSKESR